MRVYFDVTHPAHVHLFRNAIRELADAGHTVAVTSREKEMTTELLDAYDIEHTVLSRKRRSQAALVPEWTIRELRTIRFARAFDPDVVVSHLVPSAVHAARLTGAGSVVFNDHEHSNYLTRLTAPLTDFYCTPAGFQGDFGEPHVRHEGVLELAYLHPNWFTPDRNRLRDHGVDPDEPYFVLRFVSMGAHHDITRDGMSRETKIALARELSEHGEVYVSTEGPLPSELEGHGIPVPPAAIHDLLAEARLFVTDSNTMATEAAVLGTPTVRSNSYAADGSLGNFLTLEEYDLVVSTADEAEAHERALELATSTYAPEAWRNRRDRMLEDATDVTAFMLDLIAEAAARSGDREDAAASVGSSADVEAGSRSASTATDGGTGADPASESR